MGKVRVYELARDLGITSAEMLARLKADGGDVKTASSSVDDETAARYRTAPAAGSAPAKPKAKAKGGAKKGAAPAAPAPAVATPVMPKPIPVRQRAVKPKARRPLTEEERKAAEEARAKRLARLRGGDEEPSAPAAPAAAIEEAPVEVPAEIPFEEQPEVVEEAPVEAPVEVEAVEQPAEEEVVEEPAPAVEEAVETAEPAPAPDMSLPRVVGRAPAPAPPVPKKAPTPAPAAPRHHGGAANPLRVAEPAASGSLAPRVLGRIELPKPVQRPATPPQARQPAQPPQPQQPQQPQQPRGPGQGITRTFSQRPGMGLGKHRKKRRKGQAGPAITPVQQVVPVQKGEGQLLRLTEGVSVKELAEKMDVKAKDIIKILMQRGMMVTVNAALEPELASSLAEEFGYMPDVVSFEEDMQAQEEEEILENIEELGEEEGRAPVITVMGHVDHGKTSLLDRIRATDVAAGEAGGITQSIGAYQVTVEGQPITFVDTPGHEAFTTMRARGAQVTDIVVLVVAATDSVMPQTIEAINHAQAAGVPVVVAINKIDLPNAQPEKVKTDLMSHGIVVEQFGGDVVTAEVSALKGTGVPELLELLLLQAEMLNLKAIPSRRALGSVLEAGVDRGFGPTANIIVQDGTLRSGDSFIVGSEYGRVRALLDDRGQRIEEAPPSSPVQVTGLNGVPNAGDKFQVVENDVRAKEISEFRKHKRREAELAKSGVKGSLLDLAAAVARGEQKELGVVVKADVHGAVEVLNKAIEDLSREKVKTKVLHSGTGAITDSDVLLASTSNAIIVGFNVRPERSAADLAERQKVIIRMHTVIYELIEELKGLMAGLLDSIKEEEFLGRAEVRETFKVPKIGMVAGCYVQDGKLVRNAQARLVRDGVIVWEGKMNSLKRFKEDAREVPSGMECGLGLEDFNDIKVGDHVEAFNIKEVRPTLE
jgi:translation initiation factor IF-2